MAVPVSFKVVAEKPAKITFCKHCATASIDDCFYKMSFFNKSSLGGKGYKTYAFQF